MLKVSSRFLAVAATGFAAAPAMATNGYSFNVAAVTVFVVRHVAGA